MALPNWYDIIKYVVTECIGTMLLITKLFHTDSNLGNIVGEKDMSDKFIGEKGISGNFTSGEVKSVNYTPGE